MDTPTHQVTSGGSPRGQPGPSGRGKVAGYITGITVSSLVVASVVAWYVQSPPTVVSRKSLSDQGVAADGLELVGFEDHGFVPAFPFPKDATVEFRPKGADLPRKLEVKLSRTV